MELGGAWGFLQKFKKVPEANIQAEFYYECRRLGVPCILEYSTITGRHDLAVFNAGCDHLLCVIECKIDPSRGFKQLLRYQRLGVPILKLCQLEDCAAVARQIKSDFFGAIPSKGVPLEKLKNIIPLERRRRRKHRKHYVELDEHLLIRS